MLVARSNAPLEQLQNENPKTVRALVGDLAELSLAYQAIELALREFGGIDGLIVNQGMMDPVARIEDAHAGSLDVVVGGIVEVECDGVGVFDGGLRPVAGEGGGGLESNDESRKTKEFELHFETSLCLER